MAAVFKVGFTRVWGKERRPHVHAGATDAERTVAARDAEHAIAKARRSERKERAPQHDDDGEEIAGKWQRCTDIVVVSVQHVSEVEIL